MSTLELQNYLINKISAMKDRDLLQQLQEIIDQRTTDESEYVLTDDQRQLLAEGESDIANGRIVSHSDTISQARHWLEKK